jgi:chemotaxis protein methyltransferase CheR
MIGDSRPISLKVMVNGGAAVYATAVSLGLIVTELVINALKHAFPKDRLDGQVVVSYQIDDSDWKLVVSDNGIGKPDVFAAPAKGGLGTAIVKALAQQLDAKVDVASGPGGVTVSLTHATVAPQLP